MRVKEMGGGGWICDVIVDVVVMVVVRSIWRADNALSGGRE